MQEPPIGGDEDIPLGDGHPIERLAAFLIGQLDKTEALCRELESAQATLS